MTPAIYLALVLLFIPNVILAEPLHIPVARRRQIKSRDWNQEANKLRKRYGYPIARSPFPSRRTVNEVPVLDQVDIVIVLFYTNSSQDIFRV
jgi:hypothetical protein